MKKQHNWARLLAYVTGLIHQELLLQNEYLAAANRILRSHLPARLVAILVAIKVSQERFSDRFEREARAVAALNHPNICTLHDVGPDYLVMELIQGSTLADRIAKGPVPLEEALAIACLRALLRSARQRRGQGSAADEHLATNTIPKGLRDDDA